MQNLVLAQDCVDFDGELRFALVLAWVACKIVLGFKDAATSGFTTSPEIHALLVGS